MIQKGIIAQVIDRYTYKVRIPKYDKIGSATNGTKTEDLSSGIVCTIPGIEIAYSVDDVVLVSFENDELSKPIILGLLYRNYKSDSDIAVANVDSSLGDIKDNLDKLNSTKLYTHIKYSNDNGLTFTSLFNNRYYETISEEDVYCRPYFDEDQEIDGIKINKSSRVINWSIIDSNNVDVTSNIGIETTIFDSSGNIIKKVNKEDRLSNILINNSSQIDGDLYLTYRLYISKEYLDTLHVSLTTDKEILGTIQGEYLGIYTSNDFNPSLNPSDYNWVSFNTSIKNYLSELQTKIDIDINSKLLNLKDEIDSEIGIASTSFYYKSVTWTQAEVDRYCQPGYTGVWERDLIDGYLGDIQTGNVLYITVRNTGEDPEDTSDDSYGRLTLRATLDASSDQPATATVVTYDVSGEMALDALARFKSSLLSPGDETLIYGGHITTNSIDADKITVSNLYNSDHSSYINLHDGTFSYGSSNPNNPSGISWDGNSLNIVGNITANSIIDPSLWPNVPDIIDTEIQTSVNAVNSTVTFNIVVYKNGTDITASCDATAFKWYKIDTNPESATYGQEVLLANSGKSVTVNFSSFYYTIEINCYYEY